METRGKGWSTRACFVRNATEIKAVTRKDTSCGSGRNCCVSCSIPRDESESKTLAYKVSRGCAVRAEPTNYTTNPVQLRYNSGTIPVQLRYNSGTTPVQYRYNSGTTPPHLQYNSGTIPVQSRYYSGAIPVLWYRNNTGIAPEYKNSTGKIPE